MEAPSKKVMVEQFMFLKCYLSGTRSVTYCYVGCQQKRSKGVQRRSKREIDRRQPRQEEDESRERITRRNLAPQLAPAAKIDQRRRQQAEERHWKERPRGEGSGLCAHGLLHYRRNADLQENRAEGLGASLRGAPDDRQGPPVSAARLERSSRARALRPLDGARPCSSRPLRPRKAIGSCHRGRIASTLDDLTHELIPRHPSSHLGEIGTTSPPIPSMA